MTLSLTIASNGREATLRCVRAIIHDGFFQRASHGKRIASKGSASSRRKA